MFSAGTVLDRVDWFGSWGKVSSGVARAGYYKWCHRAGDATGGHRWTLQMVSQSRELPSVGVAGRRNAISGYWDLAVGHFKMEKGITGAGSPLEGIACPGTLQGGVPWEWVGVEIGLGLVSSGAP